MIRFILLQNRAGKTRLAKYYVPVSDSEKRKLEYEVHRLIVGRDPKHTNFVEVRWGGLEVALADTSGCERQAARSALGAPRCCCCCAPLAVLLLLLLPHPNLNPSQHNHLNNTTTYIPQFKAHKVVYRRYAGLFFSVGVDAGDSELAALEAVHLFVEVLDHFFSNVCELDLVFNFHKVYLILDEMVVGGEIAETSKRVILERLEELDRAET